MRKLNVTSIANEDGNFLLLKNDAIAQNLIAGKRWEPHFTHIAKYLVKEGDCVVDAGANFGHHTVALANIVGESGIVHSYEPLRIIHQQLCANVFNNGLTNVYTHNCALGIKPQSATMDPVDYHKSWINIGDTEMGRGGETVDVQILDDLQVDRKISFIKLDIQGSELNVLKGATKLITHHMPILFVEMEELHLQHFGTSVNELIQYIKGCGYAIWRIENEYPCDHLCLPQDKIHLLSSVILPPNELYKLVQV